MPVTPAIFYPEIPRDLGERRRRKEFETSFLGSDEVGRDKVELHRIPEKA